MDGALFDSVSSNPDSLKSISVGNRPGFSDSHHLWQFYFFAIELFGLFGICFRCNTVVSDAWDFYQMEANSFYSNAFSP
jgi:hypothetical protein